jgi:hypothetical protein
MTSVQSWQPFKGFSLYGQVAIEDTSVLLTNSRDDDGRRAVAINRFNQQQVFPRSNDAVAAVRNSITPMGAVCTTATPPTEADSVKGSTPALDIDVHGRVIGQVSTITPLFSNLPSGGLTLIVGTQIWGFSCQVQRRPPADTKFMTAMAMVLP